MLTYLAILKHYMVRYTFLTYQIEISVVFTHVNRSHIPVPSGCVAQLVMCLATDACLTADPGVMSLIPPQSHTFSKIDHEIISTVIILLSAESFKKGYCQLQAKICAQSIG